MPIMKLSQCLRLATCGLLLAFMAGCGSSSSNQTAPQTMTVFYSASAVFRNHTSAMYMSGYNSFGQLATGDLNSQSAFQQPKDTLAPVGPVKAFAEGGGHTLALLKDGTVKAWGSNQFGQLGDVSTTTGGG